MTKSLRQSPSLRSLKYEAKQILNKHKAGDASSCKTLRCHPRFASSSDADILGTRISLQVVHHALSIEYGFSSWTELLSGLSDKNIVSDVSETVSILDMWHQPIEYIRKLFEQDAINAIEIDPQTGMSILHLVAEAGVHPDLAELSLQYGAIDVIDTPMANGGFTPLQLSVERRGGLERRMSVAEILLSHGAYYDAFSAAARNDLDHLQEIAKTDRYQLEQVHPNGSAPIHWAAAAGALESVDFLISCIPDIDVRDRLRCTPLIVAASQPNDSPGDNIRFDMASVVQVLINGGADINAQDANGRTALHRAVWCGNGEVAEQLLDAGASTSIENNKNKRAFHMARTSARYLKERLAGVIR